MAANPLAHARGTRAAAAQASVARPGHDNAVMKTGRAAREESPPFRPNAVTIAAMMEARLRRGLPRFTSMQALFDDLHADD